ncbi:MAG: LAGLIDADG family homing endonuclease [bacterium]|nr:LAGLIDADG family homing endonuclease [bacterium]
MRKAWNRGLNKNNNLSVRKISDTMKKRKVDNFSNWREKMRKTGKIKSNYPDFVKDGDLAEFIGVILGDGHICKFPRTESLSLFSNSNNLGFVKRYAKIFEKVFHKKPTISKRSKMNCIKINIYEKNISKRLGIYSGARIKRKIIIPDWILLNDDFVVRYLRGLYEAEGCFCAHKPTGTYKLFFSNRNISMLKNVFSLLKRLGFHPHIRYCDVQLSRKEEVKRAMEILNFKKY